MRYRPLILAAAFGLALFSNPLKAVSGNDLPEGFTTLKLGEAAPGFALPGTDGKTYSLSDFGQAKVLMVLFTGTHCPVSHAIEERLQQMRSDFRDADYALVAINPNHSSGIRPDEFGYTEFDETFEDSKRYAEGLGWDFPFLYDGDEQTTAKAYGCLATPHVFIFDRDRKLLYKGRFDDSRFADAATVKSPDAINALKAALAGQPIAVAETKPHGCSTKWRERNAHVQIEEQKWLGEPITIEEIDAAGIAALRKNGTNKLRLINLWSTTCGPCVAEFPDLIAISRKFGMRDFELITISLDDPSDKAKAQKFLERQRAALGSRVKKTLVAEGRSTNNYLYTGASQDDLLAALDPDWPGPMPHTILVGADGRILYRKNGVIDPHVVKTKILEVLTTVYDPQ